MKEITTEMINDALYDGWSEEAANRGYDVFSDSHYMNGAKHIERLDCMMVFDSDHEAAIQAEKDGIAIIHDLPDVAYDGHEVDYIDDANNRKLISDCLRNKYGIEWA